MHGFRWTHTSKRKLRYLLSDFNVLDIFSFFPSNEKGVLIATNAGHIVAFFATNDRLVLVFGFIMFLLVHFLFGVVASLTFDGPLMIVARVSSKLVVAILVIGILRKFTAFILLTWRAKRTSGLEIFTFDFGHWLVNLLWPDCEGVLRVHNNIYFSCWNDILFYELVYWVTSVAKNIKRFPCLVLN